MPFVLLAHPQFSSTLKANQIEEIKKKLQKDGDHPNEAKSEAPTDVCILLYNVCVFIFQ